MERTKESAIQAAICDYLTLKGYFFSRTNNNATYDKTRAAFRALPKYTRRGWPDICLINRGIFYGIEVKAETGRLSDDQKLIGDYIERNGGRYVVARSIDDLEHAGL